MIGASLALFNASRPLRAAALLGAVAAFAGCAAPDPFASHVQNCVGAGHAPGSASFALCMSTAAISLQPPSDEARERRRWQERLLREQLEAERRVRMERAVIGLNR